MSKFWFYFSLLALICHRTRAEIFSECEDEEDGTFVASLDSCQEYVYCVGEDSEKGNCDPGEYFDQTSKSCDTAENVWCFLDDPVEEGEGEEEEEVEEITPPILITTTTVAPEPVEVDFLDIAPVVKPNCPLSDDPSQVILMANNASCTDYYLCYHGHAMEMHCTNQLHFNADSGQCDYPEKVQCALAPTTVNKCLPHMTEFFPHPDKCNYFYYCIKGFLTLQQCPFYYGWDIERRSCVKMNVAKCFGNARRT